MVLNISLLSFEETLAYIDSGYRRKILGTTRSPGGDYIIVHLEMSRNEKDRNRLLDFWTVGYDPKRKIFQSWGAPIGAGEFLKLWEQYKDIKLVKVFGEFRLVKV